ncbi:MAG TPA: glycosyltransferase [Planctomycetota bacterium]|jgi:glycosyltransferase involved in cell wall biosynthesis|nr:glycosyltransferase [Planctomycetota bacterium]
MRPARVLPRWLEPGEAVLGVLRMECFAPDEAGRPLNPGAFTRWVDSLAPHFRRIEVAAPLLPAGAVPGGAPLTAENVRFLPLPNLRGLRRCYLGAPRALSLLNRWVGGWDLANLRIPDNFLPFAGALVRRRGLPRYVSLVGHPWNGSAIRARTLRAPARAVAGMHGRLQRGLYRRALRGALCIAHGEGLLDLARSAGARAHSLPSASLWEREIPSAPPPPGPGNRLLYVGRISPEKGLRVLLEALARAGVADLRLDLVGWPSAGEERAIAEVAGRLGLDGRVRLLGFLPLGPRLFEAYREHDLLVLPSLSEGTPRVLGEGMAHGLAVVATDCGGVSDLVEHARTGLLVPPGDSGALAAALAALAGDARLRRALACRGFEAARGRTLEGQARAHFAILREEWEAMAEGAGRFEVSRA